MALNDSPLREAEKLVSGLTGKEHYDRNINESLDRQVAWLQDGAKAKVASIRQLLAKRGFRPGRVLELGSGTGAVIQGIKSEDLGQEYFAVDASETGIGYLQSVDAEIRAGVSDIMTTPNPFDENDFDLVVLSHVLEHLEDPVGCLRILRSEVKHSYLVAEVPLEDLWAGRLKSRFQDRSKNPAGHVHFFRPDSFRAMIADGGYEILDERIYAPALPVGTILRHHRGSGVPKIARKLLTQSLLPRICGPLWKRGYHAHHAVLAAPTNQDGGSQVP